MQSIEEESKSRLIRLLHKAAIYAGAVYDDFQEFLAPSLCLCCGRRRDFPDQFLCPDCLNNLIAKNIGGGPICPFCGRPKGISVDCERARFNPLMLYFWGYYEDELKECLQQFKFQNAIELGKKLSLVALDNVSEILCQNRYDLLIPVPLHKGRHLERSYNQSEIIAATIGKRLGIDINPKILSRAKPTRQQARLSENDRWENVKGAFVISAGLAGSIRGKRILLIDDIVTTGATIYEAALKLREAGPEKVDIFSLAYAK